MKLLLFLLLPLPASAELYRWSEAGSSHLSTVPPAWYRVEAPARGPRVVVTEGTRVLDDTGLPMERRLGLRAPLHHTIPADRRPALNGTKVP